MTTFNVNPFSRYDYVQAGNPATDTDPIIPYPCWLNVTTGEEFICIDATAGDNVWKGSLGTTVEVFPTEGLIAHFTMENITGSTLNSEVGSGYGTITGATQGAGVDGGFCLQFPNAGDYVALTNLNLTYPFTNSFWVYATTFTLAGYLNFFGLTKTGLSERIIEMRLDLAAKPQFVLYDSAGAATYITASTAFTDAQWNHIVWQADTGITKIYLNGSLVHSGTNTPVLEAPMNDFIMGAMYPNANGFPGNIDLVRMYNRVVTADEVTALYEEIN